MDGQGFLVLLVVTGFAFSIISIISVIILVEKNKDLQTEVYGLKFQQDRFEERVAESFKCVKEDMIRTKKMMVEYGDARFSPTYNVYESSLTRSSMPLQNMIDLIIKYLNIEIKVNPGTKTWYKGVKIKPQPKKGKTNVRK